MDTTLSDPLVDRLLDGRYAIEARVARGGMASVYLATDVRLERRVAVKVMHAALAEDPEFVARFNREARAAARLSHPDVVAVYDQGSDDGHVFLVMEYVPGATLRDVLRDRGRLSPGEAVAVMDHVLAALGAAHAAGLVHRDVKPENVLVTADGRVKVADFGLARAVAGATVTDTGMLLGTAAYLAPEQVRDGTADARSDVYSAGVMFFELLTGAPPFSGDTPISVAYRHLNEDVPLPSARASGIPAALDGLVASATARDPQQRPADGRALHAALVDVRDRLGLHDAVPGPPGEITQQLPRIVGAPVTATQATTTLSPGGPAPPDAGDTRRGRRRRWPLLVVLLVVAALVAGAGGWYLAVGRYAKVPPVLEKPRAQAVEILTNAGFHAKVGAAQFSENVAKGLVADTDPNPGSHARKGSTITLHLSKGPERHAVPDVRGMTVAKAKQALLEAKLTFATTERAYSPDVQAGRVIRTTPDIGSDQRRGTAVTLVVSRGPKPVEMPDLRNKPLDKAEAELTALGLEFSTTGAFDDKIDEGKVISTDPVAGATAHKGDTVAIVVSKGPEKFPVPDVTGKKIDDAISIINKAGFHAKPVEIFPFGPGKVVRERPTGDQPKGTEIELDYY